MDLPPRGFSATEFRNRCQRAQDLMAQNDLAALLLTMQAEVQYYSGFLTRFWESPTRPWFVVMPQSGDPIAVIPTIGEPLMRQTWLDDLRTWQAPDYTDDGISLLANTLMEVTATGQRIGIADQMESHLRMPLASFRQLEHLLAPRQIVSDAGLTRQLRMVKSKAEIDKIRTAARIATTAFDRVPEIAQAKVPLSRVFRDFQRLCLDQGADWVPYLAGGAGQGGYDDVISPATDAPLLPGDVLMLDTGLVWDGYFCDFDRNFSVGRPSDQVLSAHVRLIEAVNAAFEIARPGTLISDLFHAMNTLVNPDNAGSGAGRLGHGLGLQLTEWPSVIANDHTPLLPGMVLTLEPGMTLPNGQIMVHEENIVVTGDAPEWLSAPQGPAIRVL
ncbi:Xaa-Pro peptidase family protein [Sulfitobacter sp. F26204]|uniref:M24 family metallopeptidase n=1 Tax=Sulfitobacter sp. F26204 TaxID=2996014 RepID=UPI00225E5E49|nr:Xaa-Pro peptidase family protein [Sulfitobacter sp. F26204]MCX7558745.1 Xaa-Pro peptidase family protein [Sulfitobacter sp. F26204]